MSELGKLEDARTAAHSAMLRRNRPLRRDIFPAGRTASKGRFVDDPVTALPAVGMEIAFAKTYVYSLYCSSMEISGGAV